MRRMREVAPARAAAPSRRPFPRPFRDALTVRPPVEADRALVEAWLGDSDYPVVQDAVAWHWPRWMTGRNNLLALAERRGHTVAFAATSKVSESEAYLHGFRARARHYVLSVVVHALLPFSIVWMSARGLRTLRWVINRERFGAWGDALHEWGDEIVMRRGAFGYWEAPSRPGREPVVLPTERARELAALWDAQDRAATLWAPYWFWRRLTWQDLDKELRLGRILVAPGAYAMRIGSSHGPYLSWTEGTVAAMAECALMFRSHAAAQGAVPRALLADTPATADALAAAGYTKRHTYTVYEMALTPATLSAFGRLRERSAHAGGGAA
jgi:hypothetical protein